MSLRVRLSLERLEARETPTPIGPQPVDPNQSPTDPTQQNQVAPTPDPSTQPPQSTPTLF